MYIKLPDEKDEINDTLCITRIVIIYSFKSILDESGIFSHDTVAGRVFQSSTTRCGEIKSVDVGVILLCGNWHAVVSRCCVGCKVKITSRD